MAVAMVCATPLDSATVRDGVWSFGRVQVLNVLGMVSISLAAADDPHECSTSATRPAPEWAASDPGLRCRGVPAAPLGARHGHRRESARWLPYCAAGRSSGARSSAAVTVRVTISSSTEAISEGRTRTG